MPLVKNLQTENINHTYLNPQKHYKKHDTPTDFSSLCFICQKREGTHNTSISASYLICITCIC